MGSPQEGGPGVAVPLTHTWLRSAAKRPKTKPEPVVGSNYVLHRSTLGGMANHVDVGSVDLVVAATREYEALGRFAEHALAPHGNLLVFAGREDLPDIFASVPCGDLAYRCTVSIKEMQQQREGVRLSWHSVVVFRSREAIGYPRSA